MQHVLIMLLACIAVGDYASKAAAVAHRCICWFTVLVVSLLVPLHMHVSAAAAVVG